MTPWIVTHSGVAFTPLDPKAKDVRIRDIAHHLARICRFTGATSCFYSVAQHSCLVSRLVPQEGLLPLAGLLHDAAEAYLWDIASPLKSRVLFRTEHGLESASMVEWRILQALQEFLGLDLPFSDQRIKAADMSLFETEVVTFMPFAPLYPAKARPADIQIPLGWNERKAEEEFLKRYRQCRKRYRQCRALAGLDLPDRIE